MLSPLGTTEVVPDIPAVKSDHRICTWVQSDVIGRPDLIGSLQVSAVPGQVPPPAGLVASGSCVLSIEMLNENIPVPDEPRTQNEIPLYAVASAQPIQTPPPMPHWVASSVSDPAQLLGGCPARMASVGVVLPVDSGYG